MALLVAVLPDIDHLYPADLAVPAGIYRSTEWVLSTSLIVLSVVHLTQSG